MIAFLKSIPQTFYSRDFYVGLIRRATGIGMGFILLQTALLVVVPTLQILPALPTLRDKAVAIVQEIPEVTIKDQKLSMDKPSPYKIDLGQDDKDGSHAVILFDTSSDLTNIATVDKMMQDNHIVALITPDYLAVPHGTNTSSPIKLYTIRDLNTANKDLKITHEQWDSLAQKVLSWAGPVTLVVIAVGLLIGILLVTFFKGLILLGVTLFCTIKPSLADTMRLSAAAATPGSFFLALASLLHQPLPRHLEMVLWAGFSLYGIYFANKAAKAEAGALS